MSHMTQTANPVTLLASPLGEEGHEVAKGCTRVRMIMILDVDVTAERRHYNTHCPLNGKRLTTFCASLALLQPLLSLTHWIFRSLMLPYKSSSHSAKCVRCVSLRSGGRRLAARTAMECHCDALPCTPFCLFEAFPLKGKREVWRGKTESHIFHVPFRCVPLWWLAPPPFPRKRGHYGCLAMGSCLYRKA